MTAVEACGRSAGGVAREPFARGREGKDRMPATRMAPSAQGCGEGITDTRTR
jgi:hypothetical protein